MHDETPCVCVGGGGGRAGGIGSQKEQMHTEATFEIGRKSSCPSSSTERLNFENTSGLSGQSFVKYEDQKVSYVHRAP